MAEGVGMVAYASCCARNLIVQAGLQVGVQLFSSLSQNLIRTTVLAVLSGGLC